MSEEQGWIKFHRSLLDSPRARDSRWLSVWVYILLNATHKEMKMVFGSKEITLSPGQLITSRKSIAAWAGISEGAVETRIKHLKIDQQIRQESSSISRLITVINWDKYQATGQEIEQQPDSDQTATGQQPDTNKNAKNDNNVNNFSGEGGLDSEMQIKHEQFKVAHPSCVKIPLNSFALALRPHPDADWGWAIQDFTVRYAGDEIRSPLKALMWVLGQSVSAMRDQKNGKNAAAPGIKDPAYFAKKHGLARPGWTSE